MQLLMILIVLVFSVGLILFASPIILYLAPLIRNRPSHQLLDRLCSASLEDSQALKLA